jgi:ubiquinone/menaquinone biosynthesis C-methylase UbiE
MPIYDKFAKQYSDSMGETGDEVHQTQIDPYIYKIIGKVKGKVICDLGCGNGYMARYLTRKGAKVYASDVSGEIVKIAKEKSKDFDIEYLVHSADNLSAHNNNMFDAVIMNMSIHYLKDLDKLFSEIGRVLKKGGIFAFSTNHFFRPHYPYSEWVLGKINGKEKLFLKVTNYLGRKGMEVVSGWDKKTKMKIYHQNLNELVNKMSSNYLYTFKIFEPEPIKSGQAFSERLQKTHHIPTFIIIGAKILTL